MNRLKKYASLLLALVMALALAVPAMAGEMKLRKLRKFRKLPYASPHPAISAPMKFSRFSPVNWKMAS